MREHKPVSGPGGQAVSAQRLRTGIGTMVSDTIAHGFYAEESEAGEWYYR